MNHHHQHQVQKEHTHHADEKSHHQDHSKHHGHAEHDHGAMINDFKRRFWISLALSIPVLILSPMIQQWLGFELVFTGSLYLLFALSSVVFFYGGWPFLKGTFEEVKSWDLGMMTLIGVAITTAWLYSSATVFGLEGKMFFWELVTLIDIMLLGHWIEMRSVQGASKALELLVDMMPAEAHLVHGDHIMDVSIEKLNVGDIILIKPGEKIPADGEIIEGESAINEAMITGESKPITKGKGAEVIGGALNGNGSLKVRVKHTGEDAYLSKVIKLVEEAQKTKSKTQKLADKAAKWLTFIALGAGLLTLSVWLIQGKEFVFALERMVTVMVISCPHALGLAIPLVVAISTALSARSGLLIRNRTAFENARKISTIVFDKTGTLTEGNFGVSRIIPVDTDLSENELLTFAAALEQHSEHPIATGIMHEAKTRELAIKEAKDFQAITGKGVEANVDGKAVKVVSPGYLKENNIDLPNDLKDESLETIVFVIIDEQLVGYIALADKIREESAEAIRLLKEKGIKVIMATGDNQKVAEAVANTLSLDGVYAEVLPHQKLEIVKELQAKGEYVAMTGDGVNDAPALAQADIGIAVGSGTDVAAETADIVLVNSNPQDITGLILFGQATYKKMIQNLAWATGYNAIAIPLATGFIPGLAISPAIGAVFMSLSTVVVAINAQLLRRGFVKNAS